MRDIILGYEIYDDTTKQGRNFNGRLTPTKNTLASNVLSEEYYWFLTPELFKSDVLPEYYYFGHNISDLHIKKMCVNDIKDQIYFYPIEILQISSYVEYTSHIAISNKVIDDVSNKKAYIIFRYVNEGDMFRPEILVKFNKLISDLKLPKEQILVFHADQTVENYKDCGFTYIPTNVFPIWIQHHKKDKIVKYEPDKLFLCYNRVIRAHRVLLLGLLKQEELMDKGIISLGNTTLQQLINVNNDVLGNLLSREDLIFLDSIAGKSPDGYPLTFDHNPASVVVDDHYKNTFVSVVNETLTETVFFSEKIFKPLLMGHPFILVGGKGSLKKLKELGFKTFDRWWDEKYDECDSFIERCIQISRIVSSLNKKDDKQLQLIRHFMRPILKHNQDLYNNLVKSSPFGIDREIVEYIRKLL